MGRQSGFFDLEEQRPCCQRRAMASAAGAVINMELVRPESNRRAAGGSFARWPAALDHVLMFKVLILQTQNNLTGS